MSVIPSSELIINPDGSIYHLKVKPGQMSTKIITVGDQDRVDLIAEHFEAIECTIQNREFKMVTGLHNNQRLSVISTGIGTDNIDIVFNEIDALFNVDFDTRLVKVERTTLEFVRIGTSGAIRSDVPLNSIVLSAHAVGLDTLLTNYNSETSRNTELESQIHQKLSHAQYAVDGDDSLLSKFSQLGLRGITVTAPGFYGPQNRYIRLKPKYSLIDNLTDFSYNGISCTNLEMETAGIYGMSKLLGHKAISCNAILANRVNGEFSSQPKKTIDSLIESVLALI